MEDQNPTQDSERYNITRVLWYISWSKMLASRKPVELIQGPQLKITWDKLINELIYYIIKIEKKIFLLSQLSVDQKFLANKKNGKRKYKFILEIKISKKLLFVSQEKEGEQAQRQSQWDRWKFSQVVWRNFQCPKHPNSRGINQINNDTKYSIHTLQRCEKDTQK